MKKVKNHHEIEALLNDDKDILNTVYTTFYIKVKSFIYHNKGSDQDAEDVFHNALYQLIIRAKLKGIQINTSFEAYFLTICKNLWYKELNRRKNEIKNEDIFELKHEDDYHVASICYQDRWDLFNEMFLKLSSNCQKLLKDYFNKVPYDVIVNHFSYATKNVAFQRIFKCKNKLINLVRLDTRFKNL